MERLKVMKAREQTMLEYRKQMRRSEINEEMRDFSHPTGKLNRIDKTISLAMLVKISRASIATLPLVEEDAKRNGKTISNAKVPMVGQHEKNNRTTETSSMIPETQRNHRAIPVTPSMGQILGNPSTNPQSRVSLSRTSRSGVTTSSVKTSCTASTVKARDGKEDWNSDGDNHKGLKLKEIPLRKMEAKSRASPPRKLKTLSLLNFTRVRDHLLHMVLMCFAASCFILVSAVVRFLFFIKQDPQSNWGGIIHRKNYPEGFNVSYELQSWVITFCNAGLIYLHRGVKIQENFEARCLQGEV